MATFTNQATLIYNGQSTSSNITTGEVVDTLALTKTAINPTYAGGEGITYVVSISNSGLTPISDAVLRDNLGEFTTGDLTLTPLTYVEGSLRYYVNGALQPTPDVIVGPPMIVRNINVPAGGYATVIYEARVNEYAPLATGSVIENNVTLNADGVSLNASATVTVRDEVSLTIAKAICPRIVTDNDTLTYTFVIQNSKNREVVATDNVVVTDVFNPIINPITVTFNGIEWREGVEYYYNNLTGSFATREGSITVPGAEYTRDEATGIVSVTPGVAVITVSGRI